jgi:hypothetical protein
MQGDRPSAAWINQVKEAAVRDQFVPTPLEEYLDLFELIGDPELDSDWNEYIAPAKPVVITAIGGQKRYTRMDDYPTENIGFISQPRSGEDAPTAPTAKSGDRVFTYTHWGNREVVGTSAAVGVRFFTGTTTSAVATTDATFTVSGLAAVDSGSVPEADSGENWTVQNDNGWSIADGATGYIIMHADGSLNAHSFPQTVAFDIRYNSETNKLQKTTNGEDWTDICSLPDVRYDTENHKLQKSTDGGSNWTDILTAVSITTLTDWQYNATSEDIEEKTRSAYVLEAGSESSWTKIDDTDECQESS